MDASTLLISYPVDGYEVLTDSTEDGRDKHSLYKTFSGLLAIVYHHLDMTKAERVRGCNDWKAFERCVADLSHPKKCVAASYCKDRLCATCQWKRSQRTFATAMTVANHTLEKNPNLRFLFLTLTVPNVPLGNLSVTLDEMMKAWQRLIKRKEVERIMVGYHRALEITRNCVDDTYHPHFHVAFCVPSSYFGSSYIQRDRWLKLWQEAMRMPQITQVDIRTIRARKGSDPIASCFAEACKYGLKPWDYNNLTKAERAKVRKAIKTKQIDFGLPGHIWIRDTLEETAEVVSKLQVALHHRRLAQFGKLLADIKRELGVKDGDDDDANLNDEPTGAKVCPICGCDVGTKIAYWEREFSERYGKYAYKGQFVFSGSTESNDLPY